MSYSPGDLKLTATCDHADCDGDDCCHNDTKVEVWDSRSKTAHGKVRKGAYLPHSCDEWFIGGRTEVEAMIEDLKKVLEILP